MEHNLNGKGLENKSDLTGDVYLREVKHNKIRLRALGQDIFVDAPAIDFLRADSLWRLNHVYQPALATQTLAPEGVAIDIGAGFGAFSVPFSLAYPGWRVFCFEPDPVSFATLQTNIAACGLAKVTALPFAIGYQNEDTPQDPMSVRTALTNLGASRRNVIDLLSCLLPMVSYSKSMINNGYLERGNNPSPEFIPIQVPTLAAALLSDLEPRLVKIIAPKAEVGILSDLRHVEIDHLIGESWGHVPSSLIHRPRLGLRQTWLRRAGTDKLALRRGTQRADRSEGLDIVVAPRRAPQVDLATIDAILSDPSEDIRLLVVLDLATEPIDAALNSFFGNDPRLRVLRTSTEGQGLAWNYGRLHSTASHIAFVDDQCFPENGFFSDLLDLARQTGAEVVQGLYYLIDSNGQTQMPDSAGSESAAVPHLTDFEFSKYSYRFRSPSALMAEPPSISRRVYSRDFLEGRKIWFPVDLSSSIDFFFQTMTLRHLPNVPELDGARLGQSIHAVSAENQALATLETFKVLLQRGAEEGWNDVSLVGSAFAERIMSIARKLNFVDRKEFLLLASELWTHSQRLFLAVSGKSNHFQSQFAEVAQRLSSNP